MDTFRLKSGDTEFNTRVDALFSSLQSAAKDLEPQLKREHEEEEEEEEEEGEDGRKRPCFSRPRGRPPQWRGRGGGRRGARGGGPRNSTPDFVKNPHNWKRYDMRDTPVLSDAENKREGLRLLSDLSARPDKTQTEETTEKMELDEDDRPKVIFKKPAIPPLPKKDSKPPKEKEEEEEEKEEEEEEKEEEEEEEEEEEVHYPVLSSRKFHKPEYVVGKAKPKPKPKEKIGKVTKKKEEKKEEEEEEEDEEEEAGGKKKEVKLSYLMFEEED